MFEQRRVIAPLSGRRRLEQLQVWWIIINDGDGDGGGDGGGDGDGDGDGDNMFGSLSPDPFQVYATAPSSATVLECPNMQVYIPNLRHN